MRSPQDSRYFYVGAAVLALVLALAVGQTVLQGRVDAQGRTVQAPTFEVDPLWPKPLPNHWLLGATIGVWVDDQDNVWIIHRSSATLSDNEKALELKVGECCRGAPPVLAFDPAGNLIKSWGGPGQGYEWPESNHGITPDGKGNLFIGGNGGNDGHVLKFTRDGKFVKQFGFAYASAGSNDISPR